MAGEDQHFLGEAWPAAGISIGMLHQEPKLNPAKTVLGNVEEGVAEIKALLQRYDEINAKFAEDLSAEEMDKVLEEQGKVQDRIEAASGWDLDSRLELAMDALRLPPPDADVTTLSGGERRRVALCRLLLRSAGPAAARRADEPSRRRVGRLARAVPEGLPGHRRGRDPRSVLPRQRRRLDPRARSRVRDSVGGELLVVARAEADAARAGREGGDQAPAHARARTRVDPHVAARAPGQGQGATQRLRGHAERGNDEEDRPGRDLHRARSTPRRHRGRGARPQEGLRRRAPDGRHEFHAATRRDRRRDRSERRREDDAVPDDHRKGAARCRHAAARRDGQGRVRRPVP